MALDQLQLQMTRATFDSWLKDTWLLSTENGTWHVAVKNEFAKDWLENRLFTVINRVVASLAGRLIDLYFMVEERPAALAEVPSAEGNQPTKPPSETRPSAQDDHGLAVDIRLLNRTGYQPLTNYFPLFIEPYLHHKWGTAGQKAYSLWQKLTALDGQRLLSSNYCNWTRPVEYRLKKLAGLLARTSIQDLTGKYGYCYRLNEAKEKGTPLTECCGQYQPDCQFRAGRHCRHWLDGILEVLSDEGVLVVEAYGGRKNYHLKLQVWRSWPLLTPYQVKKDLSPALQAEHKQWLQKHGSIINVTLEVWTAEPAHSVIEQFPDRGEGQVCQHQFRRNPFRL
jgi:hypothetical protein